MSDGLRSLPQVPLRRLRRPPLRLQITLAFSASLAIIVFTLSLFVYGRLHAELVRALDSGLQSRASAIAASLTQAGQSTTAGQTAASSRLSQLSRAIADGPDVRLATTTQIMTPSGQVLAHAGIALPRLSARFLSELDGPAAAEVSSRGAVPLRMYLLPINEGRPLVIVVGTSLNDVTQTLRRLGLLLLIGDPGALVLASGVAWLMIGAALRPMERMSREAAAISVSDSARRLPVPRTNDEVARLGETLNSLLDRLHAALDHERRLLDDASHELRTPLSTLKAEIDLALSRARSADELEAALRSASEETNRLARLAQDLLVLSRARAGALPIRRTSTGLRELLERACARHLARAADADCRIECNAPTTEISVDPMRLMQAVDNLLDNAIRYSGAGGLIKVRADVASDAATITVTNPGPGFPSEILPRAFEPFVSGGPTATERGQHIGSLPDHAGAGLGLAIVRAVAQAHDGSATASNAPQGASVTVRLKLTRVGDIS